MKYTYFWAYVANEIKKFYLVVSLYTHKVHHKENIS